MILTIMSVEMILRGLSLPGVNKVGTAGTAGAGQTTFGWTKFKLDEKIIGHIIAVLLLQIGHLQE
jgi:hypothetical protein